MIFYASLALADTLTIEGQGIRLNIDSPDGVMLSYPNDISYPAYDVYEFRETDGIDFRVTVLPGYQVSQIYLYHGDGTGQFINSGTSYNHVCGLHTNLKPAVVAIYHDNSVEELTTPELWEGYFAWAKLPANMSYPSSFTPPVTAVQAINQALSDNGHTPIPQAEDTVVDSVVTTLLDGTQVVWVKWPDNYTELYLLYEDGTAEPLNGLNGRPICYCLGSHCDSFRVAPKNRRKCNVGYTDKTDDQGRKIFECLDDGFCDE